MQLPPEANNRMPLTEMPRPIETKPKELETLPKPEKVKVAEAETNLSAGAGEKEGSLDKAIDSLRHMLRKPKKTPVIVIPQAKDELTVRVEKIMEENLTDAYRTLGPVERQAFKLKGEETAYAIRDLLRKTHVKIKKIFQLILEWLSLLPGINRFYLEQEAKIKADKILSLKRMSEMIKKK